MFKTRPMNNNGLPKFSLRNVRRFRENREGSVPCFSKLTIFPFEELAETTFSNSRAKILLLLPCNFSSYRDFSATSYDRGMTFILRLKIESIFFL